MSRYDVRKQPADVVQLLDEHHLVALSDYPDRRESFCEAIESFLRQVGDTDVVRICGEDAETIDAFCLQLRRWLPDDDEVSPTIAGVAEALRFFPGEPMRRIFVWRDADAMLEHDVETFSRLINAIIAVAAEQEHLTPGSLVIQRLLLVGSSKLGAFADDESSPLRTWLMEEDDELSFWEVSICVDHPRALLYRIDG